MDTEGSLPCPQQLVTGPYPEPNETFHLHLCLLSGIFPSSFPTKILYPFVISPVHATYLAHLILLDLITPIIFVEAYKL